MSDDDEGLLIQSEPEADDGTPRVVAGIEIAEAAYHEIVKEVSAWQDAQLNPERLELDRLGHYGSLLSTLHGMLLPPDTGRDNGLDDVTEKAVARTIRAVLADVCRRCEPRGAK